MNILKTPFLFCLLTLVALAAPGCGSSEGDGKPTAKSTPDEIQRDHAVPPGAKGAAVGVAQGQR